MSENNWRRGERISSGVRGSVTETSIGVAGLWLGSEPKMASKSVRKVENTGAGMFNVGAKTIPTLRTLILLTLELLTIPIRNSERARIKVQLGRGSLCTSMLNAMIFFSLLSSSGYKISITSNAW